ncbi:glycosyltransferase family 2 protein [Candidatus Gottesmanbacteria bacterium]|nr:glycosyltransferase family 2 protein [Candidatus Gottesmanbacteria bacterium]
MKLSVVMITNNAGEVIGGALASIHGLWSELLINDDASTDGTRRIAERYGAKIFTLKNKNLGERKQWLITKARGDWVLILDGDERVSKELGQEIKKVISHNDTIRGYHIPYQNYVFGKPVYWGGERYSKVRLFRRGYGKITPLQLHEEVIVKGEVGTLQGVIHHHSFRTPIQLFSKFTNYARIAAKEKKRHGETLSLAKLFLYAPHMFWARFIKEKGYKDGWRGFVLAFAFAYMEGLTYAMLLWGKRS